MKKTRDMFRCFTTLLDILKKHVNVQPTLLSMITA